ncbi:arylamine N-acetyltransferase [Paenibacillus sp. J31TS4]|uniref:arylamine N-acetyltransferase family protein n=1 Tax=Paenibacillus sp. J31TS4 TaxID=2807195 RepID=UPI001B2EA8B9|nr:arylamine N-acetyltransferase [Paenibacillus sp. J31TS4]GIP37972.1 arylamine N-acetyltransferase [Paenibacillus sp. J31TS4]
MHESSPTREALGARHIQAYLERIGFPGQPDGSAEALALLQQCHFRAVPYENFDLLQRIPLSLELPDLYDKIVVRRRGGYCFELNALFGWLLRELGYPVTDWMARFWRDEPQPPPKRRHHVLLVEAQGERYLCDVGVGGVVPLRPLRLVPMVEQEQDDETYRLERDPEFGWMLLEHKHGVWSRIYSFTEEPQLPKDYVMPSFWCEQAPESIFRRGAIAAIRTQDGRVTVAGREFRLFGRDGVRTFTPATQAEYREALRTYLGIDLREASFLYSDSSPGIKSGNRMICMPDTKGKRI